MLKNSKGLFHWPTGHPHCYKSQTQHLLSPVIYLALPMWLWRRRRRRLLLVLHRPPGWEADHQLWSETTDWPGSRNLQSTERSKNLQDTRKPNKCLFPRKLIWYWHSNNLWLMISHIILPYIMNNSFRKKQYHFSNSCYQIIVSFHLMKQTP